MNTFRIKAIILSIVFSICILAMPLAKFQAASFPSEFFVNSNVYYSAAEIGQAYLRLNLDQQDIANYLLGSYNLFYLGSRGFQFKQGSYTSQSSFIAKLKSFGYKLFMGSIEVSLFSRFNDTFCKYASAVILYSSNCNVDFDTWFENLDNDFVIPVDQGILNSFTLLYNDNSNTAIESYGDVITPWESGLRVNFAFSSYPWGSDGSIFTNFVSDYSPVLFSGIVNYYGNQSQYVVGNDSSNSFPDTLFIVRGQPYNTYTYGYFNNGNLRRITSFDTYKYLSYSLSQYDGRLYYILSHTPYTGSYDNSIWSVNSPTNDLSDTIDMIFDSSSPVPYMNLDNNPVSFIGYYPYIGHVILVDNITTLSNPEEVYNTDSWDILGLDNNMFTPIDTVKFKPKVLTTVDLPDNSNDNVNIQDMINDNNVVDNDDNPVDPWQINVVVQPNDTNPISIDVNLFSSGKIYLEYLWEHTKKIAMFAKDILDCFEFDAGDGNTYGPKYAIYGVLVLGMAGGMIAKFLL